MLIHELDPVRLTDARLATVRALCNSAAGCDAGAFVDTDEEGYPIIKIWRPSQSQEFLAQVEMIYN